VGNRELNILPMANTWETENSIYDDAETFSTSNRAVIAQGHDAMLCSWTKVEIGSVSTRRYPMKLLFRPPPQNACHGVGEVWTNLNGECLLAASRLTPGVIVLGKPVLTHDHQCQDLHSSSTGGKSVHGGISRPFQKAFCTGFLRPLTSKQINWHHEVEHSNLGHSF
jgi:hypothetical protein